MKKYILRVFSCFLFLLCFSANTFVSYAGDIPETLLQKDYPVYFGEVKSVTEENIQIIQIQNIKGDFEKNRELTYSDYTFTDSPKAGQIYLCGYVDENNPLYIWEVDCLDTSVLTITNTDDMSKRMQEYLNDGLFEEAQAARNNTENTTETAQSRIEKGEDTQMNEKTNQEINQKEENQINASGANEKEDASTNYTFSTVIGSADGPTSIFLAGKIGFHKKHLIGSLCAGALLVTALVIFIVKQKKSKKQ